MKQQITEQRQHNRAAALIRSVFAVGSSPARHSVISNISLGGAWLNMRENQPAVGSEGKLHAEVGQMHLYLVAKVVRQTSQGIGVTFIDMGMESYENLKQLVETLKEQDDTPAPPA